MITVHFTYRQGNPYLMVNVTQKAANKKIAFQKKRNGDTLREIAVLRGGVWEYEDLREVAA